MLSLGVPLEDAVLINKRNKHDRSLSLLGLLPKHVRLLLSKYSNDEMQLSWILATLFWQGYKIWKARKVLNKSFGKRLPLGMEKGFKSQEEDVEEKNG